MVGLLIVVPILVLTLGAILFRSEASPIPLGIVNEDQGLNTPLTGELVIRPADHRRAGLRRHL